MLVAVGFSPLVVNTSVSPSSAGVPLALKAAPPVEELLSHPRSNPAGGLLQGQGMTPPTPGLQKDVMGVCAKADPARANTLKRAAVEGANENRCCMAKPRWGAALYADAAQNLKTEQVNRRKTIHTYSANAIRRNEARPKSRPEMAQGTPNRFLYELISQMAAPGRFAMRAALHNPDSTFERV
jgi:hypothetical protein